MNYATTDLRLLCLASPYTQEELKHAYFTAARKHHPDTGGSTKAFIEVKDAYERLLPTCSGASKSDATTSEGDLISDLGKGLGELVNSWVCKDCSGKGWIARAHYSYGSGTCPVCDGRGEVETVVPGRFRYCRRCFGLGYLYDRVVVETTTIIHTCRNCDGTGQIRIPNPALPKGRMITTQKVRTPRKKKAYCSNCGVRLTGPTCWKCGTRPSEVSSGRQDVQQ
jgi:DnaJ-class molecular chaperone